jgi:hypothetical protein
MTAEASVAAPEVDRVVNAPVDAEEPPMGVPFTVPPEIVAAAVVRDESVAREELDRVVNAAAAAAVIPTVAPLIVPPVIVGLLMERNDVKSKTEATEPNPSV